jgi:hypothetical protein
MYVKSRNNFSLADNSKTTSTNTKPSLNTTAIPKPYTNMETENSVSILSKTQTYLQERRKRSQSQPPEKRVNQKFEFLSTFNYSSMSRDKTIDSKPSANNECNRERKVKEAQKTTILNPRENMDNTINKYCDNSWDTLLTKKRYTKHENHKTKCDKKQTKNFAKPQSCNFHKSSEIPFPRAFLQTLV